MVTCVNVLIHLMCSHSDQMTDTEPGRLPSRTRSLLEIFLNPAVRYSTFAAEKIRDGTTGI